MSGSHKKRRLPFIIVSLIFILPIISHADIPLLQTYPTELTDGDLNPGSARVWEFTEKDIYSLTKFSFTCGDNFKVETGEAAVGFGHSKDGVIWAAVIPISPGTLIGEATSEPEAADHIWLRFHPSLLEKMFPPGTVQKQIESDQFSPMERIAQFKFRNSFHAGSRAMIPLPKDMVVDIDTTKGFRRFFNPDLSNKTVRYASAFEGRVVPKPKTITPESAETSFDQLWEAYDKQYAMFVLKPEVDWNQLKEKYRPLAIKAETSLEFARVCAEMLSHLRDLHIWVRAGDESVPVFNRPRETNANLNALESIIGPLKQAGKRVSWAKTPDKIGYIGIWTWDDQEIPGQFDAVLEEMRDTRGLIVDVRLNGGGGEDLAQEVAGRFLIEPATYSFSQYRNGPNHTDLTEKIPRSVKPCGLWRYDKPVIMLIGQRCMSSNESFVEMMHQAPNVTSIGDRTCGSSGNPRMIDLPVGVTISLPRWIDLIADGTPLDEKGVQPDIKFDAKPDSFTEKNDELLTLALERLRKQPLPDKPLPGTSIHDIKKEKDAQDAKRPKIVLLYPKPGATDVDWVTKLRIGFDQPMDPLSFYLEWKKGGFIDYGQIEYDENKRELILPVTLLPGKEHWITINRLQHDNLPEGFQAVDGMATMKVEWGFTTAPLSNNGKSERPKIISIDPSSDSEVPSFVEVKVKFDRPMDSRFVTVSDKGDPQQMITQKANCCTLIKYSEKDNQFLLPLVIPPNWKGQIELSGFRDLHGNKAEPVVLSYSTEDTQFSNEKLAEFDRAKQNPELKKIIENTNNAREKIKSMIGKTQLISSNFPFTQRGSYYTTLRSRYGTFKMHGERQFYADVSQIMNCDFIIGSDGKNCWFYSKFREEDLKMLPPGQDTEFVITCPYDEMADKNVTICDPFDRNDQDADSFIKNHYLEYRGMEDYAGKKYHIIRFWAPYRTEPGDSIFQHLNIDDLWIDAETWLPYQRIRYNIFGLITHRFVYDKIDCPLTANDFFPEAAKRITPKEDKSLNDDYDTRFLKRHGWQLRQFNRTLGALWKKRKIFERFELNFVSPRFYQLVSVYTFFPAGRIRIY